MAQHPGKVSATVVNHVLIIRGLSSHWLRHDQPDSAHTQATCPPRTPPKPSSSHASNGSISKRKRSLSASGPSLELDTSIPQQIEKDRISEDGGHDTPRTAVSRTLQDLTLRSIDNAREAGAQDAGEEAFAVDQAASPSNSTSTSKYRQRKISDPSPTCNSNMDSTASATMAVKPSHATCGPTQNEEEGIADNSASTSTSASPSKRRRRTRSPSRSKVHDPLTWHESEITGHLMDSPDDDGTGINGIGFRPTASQKVAQSRKRHQQLQAWLEQVGRDARKERAQRRINAIADTTKVDATEEKPKRSVRFALDDDEALDINPLMNND